ncbi:MAG: DUF493 domain-containing protein [Pseudomonadota bacterium]
MRHDDSLLEFPCAFDVKAMGKPENGFRALVVSLVGQHVDDLSESTVTESPSRGGKYVSVTVRFDATSRAQLDAIYQTLTDEPRVLVAL